MESLFLYNSLSEKKTLTTVENQSKEESENAEKNSMCSVLRYHLEAYLALRFFQRNEC